MSGFRVAWLSAIVVSGLACGSNVTVETGGAGGSSSMSSASGAAAGADATAAGGSGMIAGGAGNGGAGNGGSGPGGAAGSGQGGVAGNPDGSGGGLVCPGLGDMCTGCMSGQCSGVYCACSAEPHCLGYLECLGTCMQGDVACAQNCATVHEAGISAGILLADCAATSCDADCNVGKALEPCPKCLYSECASEMNACIADPECLALVQCIGMCAPGDMACGQLCVQAHPKGFGKAQDVRMCRIANCNDACQ